MSDQIPSTKKEPTFVIKDLLTDEILMDNIEKADIQQALDMVLQSSKVRGARQDRQSFYLRGN